MSALSRVKYFASLVEKAKKDIDPLLKEFSKIKDIKQETIQDLEQRKSEIDSQIEDAKLYKNESLIKELQNHKEELVKSVTTQLNKFVETSSKSIEESIKSSVNSIDGLSISITADVNSGTIIPVLTPDPMNMTTSLVKDSLTSSDTKVNISTLVTGTAGGNPIVGGRGIQIASITTT